MPAVLVNYPTGVFDATDRERFMRTIVNSTARNMDAIDPETDQMSTWGNAPSRFVDLLMRPYVAADAQMTVVFLCVIITFGWPDRMVNMEERLKAIGTDVVRYIPDHARREGKDLLSFSFLPEGPGCWVALT